MRSGELEPIGPPFCPCPEAISDRGVNGGCGDTYMQCLRRTYPLHMPLLIPATTIDLRARGQSMMAGGPEQEGGRHEHPIASVCMRSPFPICCAAHRAHLRASPRSAMRCENCRAGCLRTRTTEPARATIGWGELKFGEEARRRRADRDDGTMGRIDGPRGEAEGASAHPRHFGPPHCCCYYCCCEG